MVIGIFLVVEGQQKADDSSDDNVLASMYTSGLVFHNTAAIKNLHDLINKRTAQFNAKLKAIKEEFDKKLSEFAKKLAASSVMG